MYQVYASTEQNSLHIDPINLTNVS